MTVFLAQSAFLFVFSDALKKQSVSTIFDRFVNLSAILIFVDILWSWTIYRLFKSSYVDSLGIASLDEVFHLILVLYYCFANVIIWFGPFREYTRKRDIALIRN